MKHQIIGRLQSLCIWVGACLLILALGVLCLWQWSMHTSAEKAKYYSSVLSSLLPEPQDAVPEERRDNTMPALSIDAVDFVGLLEFPRYGSLLPVCADWGTPGKYPCQFYGSIYDRTMQIGGTTQKGQFDFYREISVGDTVCFTDMEGHRYTYAVKDIRYEKSADQTALQKIDASLTLFIKNIYALDYMIIFCDT